MKHVQIGKLVSVYLKKLGRSRYQAHAYYKDVQRDASGGIVSAPPAPMSRSSTNPTSGSGSRWVEAAPMPMS